MRRHLLAPTLLLALSLLLGWVVPALAGGAPSETIVLVNTRSDDSKRVAARYIEARHIPPTNVVRVSCEPGLTVPRSDFIRDVIEPLRDHLRTVVTHPAFADGPRSLLARARFVVLTQGMPIRADGPGGAVSTAEMLMLLDTPTCGQDGSRMPRFRNSYASGPVSPPGDEGSVLLLATALISSTPDEAIGMIDRSVASDGTAPKNAHFIYQDAAGAAGVRNGQYDAARQVLEGRGHTTEHVGRGKDIVTDRKRVMGYMSGGSYSALSPDGVATNEYLPGAICDMLQSFGAVPRNFGPNGEGGTQFPVTHMVRAGITGVQGTVAEPYNIAFPPADLFDPYERGFTLAETFHMRIPFRYWMNLVLGDPLCAPYAARTDVKINAPKRPLTDASDVTVSAKGAERVRLFLDGRLLVDAAGDTATCSVGPAHARPGMHRLLAEAVLPGEAEPRSWSSADVTIAATRPFVLARPASMPAGGSLLVPLSDPEAGVAVAVKAPGVADVDVETEAANGGVRITFGDAAPRPGSTIEVAVTIGEETTKWDVSVGPAALRIDGPESVGAGKAAEIVVTALDDQGEAIANWRGPLELRTTTPAVRWTRTEFGEGGVATLKFATAAAGGLDFTVTAPGTGLRGTHSLDVTHAEADHATTPLSKAPLGQVTDIPVRIEDKFGNLVRDWSGHLDAKIPTDPHARVPGGVTIENGLGVLRDVVLSKAGRQAIVLTDRRGKRWTQPQEQVEATLDSVRAWLVAAGDGDDPWTGDPAAGLTSAGGVAGARLFVRTRSGTAWLDLPSFVQGGEPAVATTFVQALDDTTVSLRVAAAARVRVLLDGKEIYAGVPTEANPRKAPAEVASLPFPQGMHTLTVVAERKGAFAFQLALAGEKSAFEPLLRIVADSGTEPASVVVSGAVRRPGGRGVADAVVSVTAEGGKAVRTTTARDGSWFVAGVSAGKAVVRLDEASGLAEPVERGVSVDDVHVPEIDFIVADRVAPEVSVTLASGAKAGRNLRVPTQITDESGVVEAWIEVAGARVGAPARRAPFTVEIDVAGRARGAFEFVVAARDDAGNVGRSKPATITLIADARGPVLSLRGLSRNATLKKATTVTVRATDDLGVAELLFKIDGETVGVPRTAEPFEIALDPASFEAGRHVLEVVARDLDGNESTKDTSFRVK